VRNHLGIVIDALPSNVAVARIAVATFATFLDFSVADIEEIKVAVSEAVSNCVLHAYPNGEGQICIKANIIKDKLEIVVEDKGIGITNKTEAREAGYSTLPDHMGLGFSFMDSFMDEFTLDSTPGKGTRVRMVKWRCQE
jgi:stage II sporulation protein AB (anti-sigma F factor)